VPLSRVWKQDHVSLPLHFRALSLSLSLSRVLNKTQMLSSTHFASASSLLHTHTRTLFYLYRLRSLSFVHISLSSIFCVMAPFWSYEMLTCLCLSLVACRKSL
jgi:hypothetical protein